MVTTTAKTNVISAARGKVLVVEDEISIARLLVCNLESGGYAVDIAHDGEEAVKMLKSSGTSYDVVLLDQMLPNMSGMEVCKFIRGEEAIRHVAVIMLSACTSQDDKISGLDGGADDYVTKPFMPSELKARIKAALRRRASNNVAQDVLRVGDLILDTNRMRVSAAGRSVQVSVKEFKLLKLFMSNPGMVFRRERLLQSIWGEGKNVDIRTVDVHINRLRNALGTDTNGQSYIRTVRGSGYSLNIEHPESVMA